MSTSPDNITHTDHAAVVIATPPPPPPQTAQPFAPQTTTTPTPTTTTIIASTSKQQQLEQQHQHHHLTIEEQHHHEVTSEDEKHLLSVVDSSSSSHSSSSNTTMSTSNLSSKWHERVKNRVQSLCSLHSWLLVHALLLLNGQLFGGFQVLAVQSLNQMNPLLFAALRTVIIVVTIIPLAMFIDRNVTEFSNTDKPQTRETGEISGENNNGGEITEIGENEYKEEEQESLKEKAEEQQQNISKMNFWQRYVRPRIPSNRRDALQILGLGIIIGINIFTYIVSLSLVSPTIVAIISPSQAVFTSLISVLLRREGKSILKFLGVFLAVIGSITMLVISALVRDNPVVPVTPPAPVAPTTVSSFSSFPSALFAAHHYFVGGGHYGLLANNRSYYSTVPYYMTSASPVICANSIMMMPTRTTIHSSLLLTLMSNGTSSSTGIFANISDETWNKYRTVLGVSLSIVNTLGTSLMLILQKTLLSRKIAPMTLTAWTSLIAMVLLCIASLYTLKSFDPTSVPLIAWIGLLYAGLVIGTGAFSVLAYASRLGSPTLISVYNCANPMISTIYLYIFLRQTTTWLVSIGALLITAGVLLVAYAKHKEEAKQKLQDEEMERQKKEEGLSLEHDEELKEIHEDEESVTSNEDALVHSTSTPTEVVVKPS